jgi:hypothetical protein
MNPPDFYIGRLMGRCPGKQYNSTEMEGICLALTQGHLKLGAAEDRKTKKSEKATRFLYLEISKLAIYK